MLDFKKYMEMENAAIPEEIAQTLVHPGGITITSFEDKNEILKNPELQQETGFARMANGDYLVSMHTYMPGMTVDMINWWFWWHPQDKERYQLWYPGEHFRNGYAKTDAEYFNQKTMPAFQANTQYPVEKIGGRKMPLSISFVSPETFGYDSALLKEANVATVICGHVGAFRGFVQHTEMSHIYFQKADGLFMVSRFWIGKRLKNKMIRSKLLTDETARGMAEHCCVEYRNLAAKLPSLYREIEGNNE